MFTGSGRELVGSDVSARPSIQERVDKLTVVLAEAGQVADVVELACHGETERGA